MSRLLDLVVGHGPSLDYQLSLEHPKRLKTYPSSGLVLAQLGVIEPESNLLGSGVERVRGVDQVSAIAISAVSQIVDQEAYPTETAN